MRPLSKQEFNRYLKLINVPVAKAINNLQRTINDPSYPSNYKPHFKQIIDHLKNMTPEEIKINDEEALIRNIIT